MWNTITVQYNPEIEEDWDEHFQVTCEYGYEFRRTVTFPVVGVEYVSLLLIHKGARIRIDTHERVNSCRSMTQLVKVTFTFRKS